MDNLSIIKNIFQLNNIAVVGMSPKAERPSNYVALYMRDQGYNIIPVNPGQKSIQNEMCYPSLTSIPHQVDVVNVFRRSEYVLPIAQDAIAIGAKALWLQDGVINEEASKIAQEAGLLFIMNDCMLRRHKQLH
ncbi:MAG TPA: CoA-binding protein [Candidatus Marinimicrobia bacterium]|nr:CoA-binding protein [Candidatus Neomarinimicrobiota bacterium]